MRLVGKLYGVHLKITHVAGFEGFGLVSIECPPERYDPLAVDDACWLAVLVIQVDAAVLAFTADGARVAPFLVVDMPAFAVEVFLYCLPFVSGRGSLSAWERRAGFLFLLCCFMLFALLFARYILLMLDHIKTRGACQGLL